MAEEPTPSPTPKRPQLDAHVGSSPTPAPTAPGIAIPGWTEIKLPSGKTEADVLLYNPADNDGWYYLTFELQMKDTGEVIFSTGLIPPDLYCTKVELLCKLQPGTYPCTMHVQPYKMNDDLTPTNNADFDIKLIVE